MTPLRHEADIAIALPQTTEELIGCLGEAERSVVVAGGTMIMPKIVRGLVRPDLLIDPHRLPGAAQLRPETNTLSLGPMVSYTTIIRDRSTPPLLRHIAQGITGGPQIRNQGTIAGAACHANPASDMPTGLVATGAVMRIAGPEGIRSVNARDFFTAPFVTQLAANEALVGIELPSTSTCPAFGYCKIKRSESSWPIATAAALIADDGELSLVLGAAVTRPLTLWIPPELYEQPIQIAAAIDDAIRDQQTDWWEDELADIPYRKRIAAIAVSRALTAATRRRTNRDER